MHANLSKDRAPYLSLSIGITLQWATVAIQAYPASAVLQASPVLREHLDSPVSQDTPATVPSREKAVTPDTLAFQAGPEDR